MKRNLAWNSGVALLLLTVAVYFQTWSDVWPYWEHKNATYTHGTLIAAIALWLVWRARSGLAGVAPAPTLAALPFVLVLSVAWTLAATANVFAIHALLWPALAFTVLWAGIGWRPALHFAFPLGFMYFALPIWEQLKAPLQTVAAFVVGILTSVAGVPAHVRGPYVELPDATIFITQDCSGTHFLSVALAIGALAIKFRGDGLRRGALILGVAALLSMLFNWIRIFLIVLAYLDPKLTHAMETMGHLTFGWWVFALDIVAFCLVLRLIPFSDSPSKAEVEAAPAEPQHPPPRALAGVSLAAITILVLPLSSWATQLAKNYPASLAAPIELRGLTGPIAPDPRWRPQFDGPAWTHRAAYLEPDGRIIELYRNEYHRQSQGNELVSRGTPLFDPESFATLASSTMRLNGAEGFDVTRTELKDRSGRKWTALSTYIIGDQVVPGASQAQLVTALHSLYGRPPAGVLAVMTQCAPDCSAVGDTLSSAMITAYEAYRRARG
jgi:EpsI family protein